MQKPEFLEWTQISAIDKMMQCYLGLLVVHPRLVRLRLPWLLHLNTPFTGVNILYVDKLLNLRR